MLIIDYLFPDPLRPTTTLWPVLSLSRGIETFLYDLNPEIVRPD
jgi:hypothetical protein